MNIDFDTLDNLENSPESPPDEELTQSAQDRLLVLQTKKVELVQQKEALQQRKKDLEDAIDRLNLTLTDYQRQHKQYETKEKLEYYLNQNDHEYARVTAHDSAAKFVLDNVNVLPSPDWLKRLDLVGKFLPHIDISGAQTRTEHENSQLVTVMDFSVLAKGLPTLHVQLRIHDESILLLEVANWEDVSWLLRSVSSSYCNTVKRNYIPNNKVDLLIYGYHSLAKLQHIRVLALTEILSRYNQLVVRPSKDWDKDPYVSLATLPYIELDLQSTGHSFKVRLFWSLVVEDAVTATAASHVEFAVLGEQDSVLSNANEVFLSLVPLHGIVKAFLVMLGNLFGMESE